VRKLIAFLVALAIGIASGVAAYHFMAGKPLPRHAQDTDRDDFDPGF
jgi:hypothetical protein